MKTMREVYTEIGRYFNVIVKDNHIEYHFIKPSIFIYNNIVKDFGYEYNDIDIVTLNEMDIVKSMLHPKRGEFISDYNKFCQMWKISHVDDFIGLTYEEYCKALSKRLEEENSTGYTMPGYKL